ncbi:hypothetical protein H4R19_000621 [Coemansia spiralis]|nr:hypothetical protein H4R19_000621 [Coemansia spiralis]
MRPGLLCALALSHATGICARPQAGLAAPDPPVEPIRGVNLGGLFVLEPWITPSLFEPWAAQLGSPVVDEWTYCAALGKVECGTRLARHWSTWAQEADVATLASLGINTLRIPIGYWALAPDASEPYVQGQIPYLEQVLGWAAGYGMRVVLDLHGAPGSQNGFDNSGRRGNIGWTKHAGDLPRTLDALAELARIANRHPAVVAVQALNEPANWGVPKATIARFYQLAYNRIKAVAPQVAVVFHDAFLPAAEWGDLVPLNMTDTILDTHIYHVFDDSGLKLTAAGHISRACADGQPIGNFNERTRTICGEFSLATTDCARWLNGFQRGARWDGTYLRTTPIATDASCSGKESIGAWSAHKRAALQQFAMAQLEAYERGSGWIFWNFKTESADAWNYIKLAQAGIIPSPPVGRSFGVCRG